MLRLDCNSMFSIGASAIPGSSAETILVLKKEPLGEKTQNTRCCEAQSDVVRSNQLISSTYALVLDPQLIHNLE